MRSTFFVLVIIGTLLFSGAVFADDPCIAWYSQPGNTPVVPDSPESHLGQMCDDRKRAEAGEVEAEQYVGSYYSNPNVIGHDYAEAAKWLRKAAEQNSGNAAWELGRLYRDGHGVAQDYNEAVKWLRISADQGNPDAQKGLSELYAGGLFKHDDIEAYFWISLANSLLSRQPLTPVPDTEKESLAAEKLTKEQIIQVRKRIEEWKPVKAIMSPSPVTKELEEKAKSGDLAAQLDLADRYHLGYKGLRKDDSQSLYWYTKAAEQGDAKAAYMTGFMSDQKMDYVEGIKWYRKAAEKDDTSAQAQLGGLYSEGRLCEPNYEDAYFWLSLALVQHGEGMWVDGLIKERDDAASHLSSAKLAELQQRVKDWKPEKK